MQTNVVVQKGTIPFGEYRTWYRMLGDLSTDEFPLVLLHGGPGITHRSLEPLDRISQTGRPVILYDQIGCGNSKGPEDLSTYNLALFIEEIANLRRELDLKHIHLLGHSWGGVLALEYLLTQVDGVVSLILNGTPASKPVYEVERLDYRAQTLPEVHQTMLKYEKAGDFNHPAYQAARQIFEQKHCCRVEPWPEALNEALSQANWELNHHLWTGELREWDVTERLNEVQVPTLITMGRYDGYVPGQEKLLCLGMPTAELVYFENSSHYAHMEEVEAYQASIVDFMERVEARL